MDFFITFLLASYRVFSALEAEGLSKVVMKCLVDLFRTALETEDELEKEVSDLAKGFSALSLRLHLSRGFPFWELSTEMMRTDF